MVNLVLPATTMRVSGNTDPEVNEMIKGRTIAHLECCQNSDVEFLNERINALHREWDTERVLETTAASLVVASTILGFTTRNKNWFFGAGVAGAFLLQHALCGWCPTLPIIRKAGVRTTQEIYNEMTAIKMMRGDFSAKPHEVEDILDIAGK